MKISQSATSLTIILPLGSTFRDGTLYLRLRSSEVVEPVKNNVSAGQGKAALSLGLDLVLLGVNVCYADRLRALTELTS